MKRTALAVSALSLVGCALTPPAGQLEYLRFSTGNFSVSTDKVDNSSHDIGAGFKLNPSVAAHVAPPKEGGVSYELRLWLTYMAYGEVPFLSASVNGHSYPLERITYAGVNYCSARCSFTSYYAMKITAEDMQSMALAPKQATIVIPVAGKVLYGNIPTAEVRAVLEASGGQAERG